MSTIRQQRTAGRIKTILSELVLRDLRDPRLQNLTITDVTIDRELLYADIYVNALGDDSREKEVMFALQGATGFIRKELASRLNLRTVPNLHFHWDIIPAQAERVSRILDDLDVPPDPDSQELKSPDQPINSKIDEEG